MCTNLRLMLKSVIMLGPILPRQKENMTVPSQEEGHIEQRGEVGKELEGEHLDCEAPLRGHDCAGLLCIADRQQGMTSYGSRPATETTTFQIQQKLHPHPNLAKFDAQSI